MEEGYTVIRVKRKVTEDPERGLQLSAKKVPYMVGTFCTKFDHVNFFSRRRASYHFKA